MIEATILTWIVALGAGAASWMTGADTYLALRGRAEWGKVLFDAVLAVALTAMAVGLVVTA